MTDWKKVESSVIPSELDTTSSKTIVYIRKDISEEIREDMLGKECKVYTYLERVMTIKEYQEYLISLEMTEKINNHKDQEAIDRYTQELMDGGLL